MTQNADYEDRAVRWPTASKVRGKQPPNADLVGECTHSWKTCPVHNPEGGLPPMWKVIRCVYGDYETKDGEPMSDEIAKDINDRIWDRLAPNGRSET